MNMNKLRLSLTLSALILACMGSADATGTVDPAALRTAMQAARPAVSRCYAAVRAEHPEAAGSVVVRFTLDGSGRVQNATASGMESYPALGACVVGAVAAVRFPAPTGGEVRVSYPFAFRPE